jgi:hypothetical protein
MSSKRIKIVEPQISSRDEAERVMGEICKVNNEQEQIELGLKAKILLLKEGVSAQISGCKQAVKAKTGMLYRWAMMNMREFGDARSIETVFGKFGFHMGNWEVKLDKHQTDDGVIQMMFDEEKEPESKTEDGRTVRLIPKYVRVVYQLDRERLIRDREEIPAEALKRWGVEISRDDSFYVEPKQEPKGENNLVKNAA